MANYFIASIFLLHVFVVSEAALAASCEPTLWPGSSFSETRIKSIPISEIKLLEKQAKKMLQSPPKAILKLGSAGKTSINDQALKASREAFRESDYAATIALMYKITNNEVYFNAAKDILLKWAKVNEPTGNPIDETRLQGLIWAYDLIACNLNETDKAVIKTWFEKLRQKKLAWQFGPNTKMNNHRVHQLKMLMLLDRVLKRSSDWQTDLSDALKLATINLNPETGVSFDYLNRSSLYYHNYAVEAWVEINLLAAKSISPIEKSFDFLITQIRNHNTHNEFSHSQAKIDGLRAKGGFDYAKAGSTFDSTRAAPTIITFYSVYCGDMAPDLLSIVNIAKPSPWLAFIKVRKSLWNNCQERKV